MNGAESLVSTLEQNGIDVCFANPGTSEMHFVSALDNHRGMRSVLCLFEGVVTGAADGYYRIAGKPAATLLHLGSGLGNGLANLHNARKARSAVLNIVGDHATYHMEYESPLRSDTMALSRATSDSVVYAAGSRDVADATVSALSNSRDGCSGRISTLVLPADTAWGEGRAAQSRAEYASPPPITDQAIQQIADTLIAHADRCTLLLGQSGTTAAAQHAAKAIAQATGCKVYFEFYNARLPSGKGLPNFPRIPYSIDAAVAALRDTDVLVLAGALKPIAFFAYPGKPSELQPPGSLTETLAAPQQDVESALLRLADALRGRQATTAPAVALPDFAAVEVASATWNAEGIAATVAQMLPENAIVVDESISSGRNFSRYMATANPHDWLSVMGGAIGFGLPAALGAGLAAPDRQVVVLEGDGSGMYTVQALWSMARESLPVVVIVFANRTYEILRGEFKNVGARQFGDIAQRLLSLDNPPIEWASMASALGVPSTTVSSTDELRTALARGFASKAPYLIEALI